MTKAIISSPQPLSREHFLDDFDCNNSALNIWLQKKALKNEGKSSRTFVVCDDDKVVGFYAIATGAVIHADSPKKLRRNMPDPIPVIVLGRLAVDYRYQKMGVGKGLLKDVICRAENVNANVGFRALMVHALDEDAKAFYEQHGFIEAPDNELTLFLSLPLFKHLDDHIEPTDNTFDSYMAACLNKNMSGRLALIFLKEHEITEAKADKVIKGKCIQNVCEGQALLAEGLCFEDLFDVPGQGTEWDYVAMVAVLSDGKKNVTRASVEMTLKNMKKMFDNGDIQQLAIFDKGGMAKNAVDSGRIKTAEFVTDIN